MVSDDTTICAHCGDTVEAADWHPAATETTSTGDLRIHTFCSDTCREQWLAETDTSSESVSPAGD